MPSDLLEQPIKIGDRVAMSVQWLRSTGQTTGDVPQCRGTVRSSLRYRGLCIAIVAWDGGDAPDFPLPEKVNVKNLAKVGLNAKFSAC